MNDLDPDQAKRLAEILIVIASVGILVAIWAAWIAGEAVK